MTNKETNIQKLPRVAGQEDGAVADTHSHTAGTHDHAQSGPARGSYLAALALGALGVVYGDIGTSPLYALREVFHGPYGITPNADNVYEMLSLVFWALIIVISISACLKLGEAAGVVGVGVGDDNLADVGEHVAERVELVGEPLGAVSRASVDECQATGGGNEVGVNPAEIEGVQVRHEGRWRQELYLSGV